MSSIVDAFSGGTDKFKAASAPIIQQDFTPGLQNSADQFNGNFQNQNQLGSMLMNQANGQGPNPAQLMLNQATNQNIHQNAGFMASQKGINPALAMRQAGMNQANMSQQAAGQGALMGAQQQLAAQGQLQSLYGTQGQQALGMNQNLQSAQGAQNNAIVGNTSQMNQANSGAAAANAAQTGQMIGGLLGGAGAVGAASLTKKAHGGLIDGKAPVPGDSPKNDTVPAMLSPGEIVIPRSVANDPKKAMEFIQHVTKQKEKTEDGPNISHILKKHRELGELLKKHSAA